MLSREEAGRPMKKKVVLPVMAVLLVGLWMILVGQGAEDLAELYVTKIVLDPPSTIHRGETVEVYARVMNTGARSADGFNISFFYRHQNSAGNWTLHETVEGVSLPPSHQDFYEVTFYLDTMDMDLGTYDLRIVADSANHISETDELNNELRTTMTLRDSSLGLPDLQPVSIAYAHTNPSAVDDMEPWNVTTQIQNLGEVQAGQFVVAFLVDGAEFARQIRFVLPAGGVTDVTAELDPQGLALEPGTHRVAVVIDPEDEVLEQNEGNNTVSGSLTLQSVELVPLSLAFDRSLVRLDEEIGVSAEIRNDGEGVAKDIEVAFYAGHVRFATATIAILGRGMSATVEGILDPEKVGLTDAPAVYEIRVVVDPNDVLHEFDEANNEMSRTLTIHPPEVKRPELHPESIELSPPSPAELGRADSVTVSTTIKNTGRAAAEGFDVAFYYRVKGGLRWEPFPCSDAVSCQSLNLSPDMQSRHVGALSVLFLTPGVYEIRVLVDPSDAIDEHDETNNELVTTLTLLASRLPDLAFCPEGGIAREPFGDVPQGQTIRFSACIANLGEQNAGPFTVRFSYCPLTSTTDGTSTAAQCSESYSRSFFTPAPEIAVPGLDIGESIAVPVILESRDLLPRQYRIRVEIDPDGDVRERDPFNNVLETHVTVLGPDLTIATLATSPEDAIDQTQVDAVEVAATVLNIGVVPTGEFTVRFRLSRVEELGPVAVRVHSCDDADASSCREADYFGTVTLSGIGVLVPEQVRCTLDLEEADLPPGQYVITAEVDCEGDVDRDGVCEGRIAEHNEVNNAQQIPILLVGTRLPDLAVDSLTTEPAAIADWQTTESIDVIATVSNAGVKAADPFDVLLRVFRVNPLVDCDGRVPLECADLVYTSTKSLVGMIRDDVRDVVWSLDRSVLQGPGRYILRIDVDCDRIVDDECVGRVSESNEANNSAELTYGIGGEPYTPPGATCVGECPDLRVRSLSARLENGGIGTARVTATIENIGAADAGPFTVAAYYVPARGDDPIEIVDSRHRTRYDGLEADETVTFRQDFDASALPNGFYDVFVVVDVDNEVFESKENNNTKDEALWIH
jgi:subtilase family serine protease